jgi:hypothetical protein
LPTERQQNEAVAEICFQIHGIHYNDRKITSTTNLQSFAKSALMNAVCRCEAAGAFEQPQACPQLCCFSHRCIWQTKYTTEMIHSLSLHNELD